MKPDGDHDWTSQNELEWTAFQYISNDLGEEGAREFEQRLADDQQAREAVTRCVQIAHAVISLEEARLTPARTNAVSSAPQCRRQQVWAVLGSVAALLAICAAFWIGTQQAPTGPADSTAGSSNQGDSSSGAVQTAAGENPVAIIDAWLHIDATASSDTNAASESSARWDNLVKTLTSPPIPDEGEPEGEFAWVVAALDETTPDNGDALQPREPK